MQIGIQRTLRFAAGPARAFSEVTALHNMPSFEGFALIPGIAEVQADGDVGQGSVLRVRNTDGSTHSEYVEAYEPSQCYRIRLEGFDSPFRFLVAQASEQLDFFAEGSGTRVEREFRFDLTSPWVLPLALPLLHGLFAHALDRNYERLREIVDG